MESQYSRVAECAMLGKSVSWTTLLCSSVTKIKSSQNQIKTLGTCVERTVNSAYVERTDRDTYVERTYSDAYVERTVSWAIADG